MENLVRTITNFLKQDSVLTNSAGVTELSDTCCYGDEFAVAASCKHQASIVVCWARAPPALYFVVYSKTIYSTAALYSVMIMIFKN